MPAPRLIVVDGYVWLPGEAPGLGARLFEALGGVIPVVGVAKSRYSGDVSSASVLRGTSHRPLQVSCVGVELADAAVWVRDMHGPHRIPTLLQQADHLSRTTLAQGRLRAGP